MKIENKKTLILTTLVCLLPIIAGAVLFDRLPETMATHWDVNGVPDGWSSRAFAVFGLPALVTVLNLVLFFGLNTDPKRANMSSALKTVALWTCPAVSLLCSGVTLAWGVGYELRIERIIPCFVGLLFVIIGNYIPKTKQSYTMGIKLPWTLASEENWNRTHRLAGFLWVLGGVYFIVMSFIGWNIAAFLIPLAVMVLVPTAYSYLLYRKGI